MVSETKSHFTHGDYLEKEVINSCIKKKKKKSDIEPRWKNIENKRHGIHDTSKNLCQAKNRPEYRYVDANH